MRMLELQNSTRNVYYRKRGCDGLASLTPYDIVCNCLIIEKAERPAFLLTSKFSCFNDLFSEPKLSRIIFDQLNFKY